MFESFPSELQISISSLIRDSSSPSPACGFFVEDVSESRKDLPDLGGVDNITLSSPTIFSLGLFMLEVAWKNFWGETPMGELKLNDGRKLNPKLNDGVCLCNGWDLLARGVCGAGTCRLLAIDITNKRYMKEERKCTNSIRI